MPAPAAPGPGQPLPLLLLSCISLPICSVNAAGFSHYFMWLSQTHSLICVLLANSYPNRVLPLRTRALLGFGDTKRHEERPCSWRMGMELRDSGAILVALICPEVWGALGAFA